MKNKEKGFVLAEAIIVAVFIVGLFAYMATNIFPLVSRYKIALKYDNPNEVYLANVLYDEILKVSGNPTTLDSSIIKLGSSRNYILYSFSGTSCSLTASSTTDCTDTVFSNIYIQKLAVNHLKIEKIAVVRNISNVDVSKVDKSMAQYVSYKKNKISNMQGTADNRTYFYIKFTNGNFGYVATGF